jgi:calcium-translocating P-type ATPase
MNWHSTTVENVANEFGVDIKKGIPKARVDEMREKYGSNKPPEQKVKHPIILFLEQFNDPVIYILLVAIVINALIGSTKDAIVIGAVVILNTLIGFIQERRASDALKALREMSAPTAKVLRDGIHLTIPADQVVCGDIIYLESGVRLAADARLIDTQNLLVDESMLTGESFSIIKDQKADISESAPLGDRITMVYSGTIIQKGRGAAIVTAVGGDTEFGKISEKVAEAEETVSPLQLQMAQFSKYLSIGIMSIVVLIFIVGFLRGNDWLTMMMTSIGLAVSAIPEGLPVAVTITLSIGLYQMAKQNAIVKKLAAVETLGSTNVICTDKTGTLTKNQMTASAMICGGEMFEVYGAGYVKHGKVIDVRTDTVVYAKDRPGLEIMSMISMLCTESSLVDDEKEWKIEGDPTEAALMIAAHKLDFNANDLEVKIDIPFESENQLMAVRALSIDKRYIMAKGAPERILERCEHMINIDGNKMPIEIDGLKEEVAELSEQGLRVLALCYKETDKESTISIDDLESMIFAGFVGIEDAVRPEAREAVEKCFNAGIKVVMITGDHAKTAQAVAKSVGIGREKDLPTVVTGVEIDEMTDEELFERCREIDVYARVAPQHKYRIVRQIQANENIVSMTGDGVNDAPALKQADIGVAMGSGTDVAKEAAHMVLIDDNFVSIVKAVRRGRVILHNLQHILLYILATSFGGLLTIAISVAIGFPLPVLPAQLLWINLVTDGTSTFPLAFEKEHGDVMVFLPRKKNAPLITMRMIRRMVFAGVIMMIGTLGIFYWYGGDILSMTITEIRDDEGLMVIYTKAQTMAFCVLAFFQIWNVQNSRSDERSLFFNLPYPGGQKIDRISPLRNPTLLAVMVLAIVLQVSAVALPFMNTLLDTVPLTWGEWGIIMGLTFSIVILIEMVKVGRAYLNLVTGRIRDDVNVEALRRISEKEKNS